MTKATIFSLTGKDFISIGQGRIILNERNKVASAEIDNQQLGELGWLLVHLAGKIDNDSVVELISGLVTEKDLAAELEKFLSNIENMRDTVHI